MEATAQHDEAARTEALRGAERMALNLLDAIEDAGFIQAGRTEREIELDIRALAREKFGIERDWHKRIVRAGINTLSTAADNPPIRTVEDDDIVFLDLGPVLEEWEADVGRSYAVGPNPQKHALCRDLPRQFDIVKRHFEENPEISGAELYAFACDSARKAGWKFGGKIAGHIVAEFPHARIPGVKQLHHVSPENPDPMRNLDANGRVRHWILEIHLVSPDGAFGGFYERLLEG
ncbi:M24 family metallopeptidase [Mesorhizobium comanense]|uniref:M24 family metallopeptidase n=1 Tax=Mesorhizobium comanense TaxID=2502215 RepID=UPI0010F65B97|nr:M24 family metallopeptidase [Mesorhizobium comanense]